MLSGLGEKINQFERVSAEVKTRSEAEENLLPELTRLENLKNELLSKKETLDDYIDACDIDNDMKKRIKGIFKELKNKI